MAALATTRTALLQARATLQVALSGARLLRSKRQVLAGEFFKLLSSVLDERSRVDEALREAQRALTIARALDGTALLETLSAAAGRDVPLTVTRRRVWGAPTPELSVPRLQRAPDARGASPLSWSPTAVEAARLHERSLELLLDVATRESLLRRLGEEIRETSRRINALEQLLVPRLRHELSRITLALDERAREESTRLKRSRSRVTLHL